jgi:hypothetical protein
MLSVHIEDNMPRVPVKALLTLMGITLPLCAGIEESLDLLLLHVIQAELEREHHFGHQSWKQLDPRCELVFGAWRRFRTLEPHGEEQLLIHDIEL